MFSSVEFDAEFIAIEIFEIASAIPEISALLPRTTFQNNL